jgi:hypothetical protein
MAQQDGLFEQTEAEKVVKGGVCWFQIAAERGPKGLVLYVKTAPQVEEFVKGLGNGGKDGVDAYGRGWSAAPGGEPLEIHRIDKDLQNMSYTLNFPTIGFREEKMGRVNLSFLRIVGVGSPTGAKFMMNGPFSKQFVKENLAAATQEARSLIRDYIVPIHINLRISSQEL